MLLDSPEHASNREADWQAYAYMKQAAKGTIHGLTFDMRDFIDDEFSLLKLDTAFIDRRKSDMDTREQIIRDHIPYLIADESFAAFTESMEGVFASKQIKEHLETGGSVAFVTNHRSYADKSVEVAAASLADPDHLDRHTTFIHRQVGLYKIRDTDTKVVDDGLLHFTNILQTFPDSPSGKADAILDIRETANRKALRQYMELLKAGHQVFFIAASGTQDKLNTKGELVMARVGDATASILAGPNRRNKQGLLTIPLFMDCNPFQPDGTIRPHDTPFAFLPPRFLRETNEVHETMKEIAAIGNRIKRPETPTVTYSYVG